MGTLVVGMGLITAYACARAPEGTSVNGYPRHNRSIRVGWDRAYFGFCPHKPVALREHEPEITGIAHSWVQPGSG